VAPEPRWCELEERSTLRLPPMAHRILLKMAIPPSDDDWCSARFSLLRAHLAGLVAPDGSPLYEVVARPAARCFARSRHRHGNRQDHGATLQHRRCLRPGSRWRGPRRCAVHVPPFRRLQLGASAGLPLLRQRAVRRWHAGQSRGAPRRRGLGLEPRALVAARITIAMLRGTCPEGFGIAARLIRL